MKSSLRFIPLAFLFVATLHADLTVVTLNCFLCFSQENHEKIKIVDIANGKLSTADYKTKIADLASLAVKVKPDFIGLEEIGGEIEAADLANAIEAAWPQGGDWKMSFVQGKDTQTGEDVASLVRVKAAKFVSASREDKILGKLSKHLVTNVEVKGVPFAIVTVHLVRPMMGQEEHHREQLEELESWVNAHKKTAATVVLGDFNDTGHNLLPLDEAAKLTHDAPTHMDKKEYDHIFAPKVKSAQVTVPGYPAHPDKHTLSLWTDHFMLSAVVDR